MALLAIADPVSAVPVFLALTRGQVPPERSRSALRASTAVFLILVGAAVGGRAVLSLFGVSLPALEAGGGLVILLIGLDTLRGAPTGILPERAPQPSAGDAMIFPFAMPLIAGPGAIVTVITLAARSPSWRDEIGLLIAVAVTSLVLFALLRSSLWLDRRLSDQGYRLFSRFMGLILVTLGAQFVLSGVRAFLWQG